ncbi:MAG: NAD(P)H-dependent oxidoreductase [Lachnospiraceae bacterium]|nr:NAD(P)H-dependent oxidoreductase [Lachnospiraceae bacterium]
MKILVLNGSPKGQYSITLQTIHYLQKLCPKHEFEVLHVGQRTKALEKDFTPALEAVTKAKLIIFSYPVYTFIAPYQLHRFMELLKASGVNLKGKFVTQLTTSKHFYDVTAHRYIQDNCQDMEMKFIRGLSADMDDLLTKKGQKEAKEFLKFVFWSMKNNVYEELPVKSEQVVQTKPVEVPENVKGTEEKPGDVVIVTDCEKENTQLQNMIARFRNVFPRKTRVVNIREYPFIGGCLGCFSCAVSGKCIYIDKFDEFLRNEIQTAESIVYAFSIKDHSMGAQFKLYDDRQFCNGHRTVTMGMPFGYLVSGNYSEERNLQMILEARAQVGGNFLAGVATDEVNPDDSIDKMAAALNYALEHKYIPPQNFYGIGGMKIFRDLIWIMQGMMKADHKFYKAHGQYDFPQKQWATMLKMYLVGGLISNPKIKAKMGNAMNEGMLMPYKKLLEEK